jgi:hypothetical protein
MTNEELKNEIDILKRRLDAYEHSDRFIMSKTFQLMDGRNIQLGKGTGTKIGTEATQKIGFFGVSPVAQQGHISAPSGGVTVDGQARGAINAALTALAALGFIA